MNKSLNNNENRGVCRLRALFYDWVFGPMFGAARRQAVELLALQPGERLLIPGVGTGLDLPYLPPGLYVTAVDINPAILPPARRRGKGHYVTYRVMDVQALEFPDQKFDAVLLCLTLSVVPDSVQAFREVWRVLRPGGMMVIFDRFLSETAQISPENRVIIPLMKVLAPNSNRRLSEILMNIPDLKVKQNKPSLLNGQYRFVVIQKQTLSKSSAVEIQN